MRARSRPQYRYLGLPRTNAFMTDRSETECMLGSNCLKYPVALMCHIRNRERDFTLTLPQGTFCQLLLHGDTGATLYS